MTAHVTSNKTRSGPDGGRGPRRGRFGIAPRLLATSPIGFVVVVVTTLGALAVSGVEMLSEADPAQFASAAAVIAGRNIVYLLAMVWGTAGVVLVARRLLADGGPGRSVATTAIAACGVSLLAGAAQIAIPLLAIGFSQPRFGDTASYDAYFGASLISIWTGVVAVLLVALAARAAGVRRTFTLVLAVVCAAYLVVDLTTRGGIPPFAIAVVWLALGVGLRASRVPA